MEALVLVLVVLTSRAAFYCVGNGTCACLMYSDIFVVFTTWLVYTLGSLMRMRMIVAIAYQLLSLRYCVYR